MDSTTKHSRHGVQNRSRSKHEQKALKYKHFKGNKQEGQGFADKRKKQMTHAYHKVLARERSQLKELEERTRQIYEQHDTDNAGQMKAKPGQHRSSTKLSRFHKAETMWKQKQEEKERRRKEQLEKQKEKDAALARYKEKKKAAHKKLSKKTYKGQPNMAAQMDLLLQRIEKQQQGS